MKREPPETRDTDEYIRREVALNNIELRGKALGFLIWAYSGLLIATVAIIFCQGFNLWGFELDQEFLNWLGAATVGEVAGLGGMVWGYLFKTD